MEDLYLKIIIGLLGILLGLISMVYKSIIDTINKNDVKTNNTFGKLEKTFNIRFKDLETDVKENNAKIKDIIARQDTEIQLINKQISLHDSEIKYLTRRINRIEGMDSDHY